MLITYVLCFMRLLRLLRLHKIYENQVTETAVKSKRLGRSHNKEKKGGECYIKRYAASSRGVGCRISAYD